MTITSSNAHFPTSHIYKRLPEIETGKNVCMPFCMYQVKDHMELPLLLFLFSWRFEDVYW